MSNGRVLNIGGGAGRFVSQELNGYEQVLLDIDPAVKPDICMDASKMSSLPGKEYDAVFCSHALEHFYRHEVPVVLDGFQHVLKDDGFAQVYVPDVMALMQSMIEEGKDLFSTWYRTSGGERIEFHDVLYGWNKQMAQGNTFYAHKCGFSEKTISKLMKDAGFKTVYVERTGYDLHVLAFKRPPSRHLKSRLGL
jgi:ubiquinone/menaquinone biosynthesis C-methylase UbiE